MENTSNTTGNKNQNQEMGAFWKRTSKGGMQYLAGHVTNKDGTTSKVVVFKNDKKTADNQPDYRIYESKPLNGQQEQKQAVAQTTSDEDLM
jgi:uncharacterized protein (DUF736 family)|tara:strand:+ start:21414 stop:21686 length:273 start_codon:yes stop_codon:yes gene_type:complete